MAEKMLPPERQEPDEFWRNRYRRAIQAGLTVVEAHMFADGPEPLRILDMLTDRGCPVDLIREIVL